MSRDREVERVVGLLLSRQGYFNKNQVKKSYKFIAKQFDTTPDTVKRAVDHIKYGGIDQIKEAIPLPDLSLKNTRGSYSITEPGTYWITGCVHAPFQNQSMYDKTLKFLSKEVDLNGFILAGDFLDLHSLSAYDREKVSMPNINLETEYQGGNELIDLFEDELKNIKYKVYLFGNHEDRYFRTTADISNSKYGGALKSPVEGLKLADRGFVTLTDWKSGHIKMGKYLEVNHGEFCNVHTAKKTIDTYRRSVLYHHTHRYQIYTEGLVGGFNMGWGGDVNSPVFNYATRAMKTSWMNCSSLVTIDEDQFYHVQPLLFINNKLIVNGKLY